MQEMDQEVAENYLELIDKKGDYFYTRNAICKYNPSSIGLANYDRTDFNNAISVGLCQNVIDIFNSDDLNAARIKYLEKYKPSKRWDLVKQDKSMPWQYYHHALYQRKHNN